MQLEIDPKGPTSPSEQIADQVRFAVAAGVLVAGEQLPSVRVLAETVLVNPNTIARAWRELEREGVLAPRPGRGVFVAEGARARCRIARDRIVRERLRRVVEEGRQAGLVPAELRGLLDELIEEQGRDDAQEKSA